MAIVSLPYKGRVDSTYINDENLLQVIRPRPVSAASDAISLISKAMASPVGSPRLRDIVQAKKAKKALIAITDTTRPSPDALFLPFVLKEINDAGIPDENIMILIANGMHRISSPEEMRARVGAEIFNRIRIFNNEATQKGMFEWLGSTEWGCPIWMNKLVTDADVVVSTGVIEPHIFAGYSGGRKSIAIGAAGEESIRYQHRTSVLDHPLTRIGVTKGNIFHENATHIARKAGLDFIINAVLNERAEVVEVVAGDLEEAFDAAVVFASSVYEVPIAEQADIVVTGVPESKAVNLFQATRGASYVALSPFPSVRRGGLIIVPAYTEEGAGRGPVEMGYYDITRSVKSPEEIIDRGRSEVSPAGGHRAYVMALTLAHAEVGIVGSKTPNIVKELFMTNYSSIDEAVHAGFRKMGKAAKISVLPDSLHVFTSKAHAQLDRS